MGEGLSIVRKGGKTMRTVQNMLWECVRMYVSLGSFWPIANRTKDGDSTLIIPSEEAGNIGDEAMLVASVSELEKLGYSEIYVLSFGYGISWSEVGSLGKFTKVRHLSLSRGKNMVGFLEVIKAVSSVYVLGADIMDGYYSEKKALWRLNLLDTAARIGKGATAVGFSFNSNPTEGVKQKLQKVSPDVRFCVREKYSYERLKELVGDSAELVGDSAFMLKPSEGFESETLLRAQAWISEMKEDRRTIVGINLNTLLCKDSKGEAFMSNEDLVAQYVDLINSFWDKSDESLSFFILPHDFRDLGDSDYTLALALYERLPSEVKKYCIVMPRPFGAADIKYVCGEIDFCISGKMHLAIATLGRGTPIVCLTYQDKFEGLYEHFDLLDLRCLMSPEEAFQRGSFFEFAFDAFYRRAEIRSRIQSNLPRVLSMSERNFASVGAYDSQ